MTEPVQLKTPLLTVSGLCVDYESRGSKTHAVRGVDFTVAAGTIVAIVGESGSGKSTISQSLVRSLAEGGRIVSGSIDFEGRDLVSLHERSLRRIRGAEIGFVPQDPSNSLNPLMLVGEQIAESLRLHKGMNRADAAAEAVRILDEVGIPDAAARAAQFPHELSGGMKQRVLIGIAWACTPKLVIADEPTSALDVTVQRHVLDRLESIAREHGTSVILVTHDLAVAADRADHIIVMQQGLIVDQGPTAQVLGQPAHDYTRELVASAPGLSSSRLEPRPVAASETLTLAFRTATAGGVPDLLEVQGLTKRYTLRRPGAAPSSSPPIASRSACRGAARSRSSESRVQARPRRRGWPRASSMPTAAASGSTVTTSPPFAVRSFASCAAACRSSTRTRSVHSARP